MLGQTIQQKFLAFVFRPECFVCNESLQGNAKSVAAGISAQICFSCLDEMHDPLAIRCELCCAVLRQPSPFEGRCANCRDWKPKFENVVAIANYSGVLRDSIVEIKRDFRDIKAYQLGLLLGEQFELLAKTDNVDGVIAVPSHWRRRWSRRGFQPSNLLADGFCKATGLAKLSNTLKCVKFVQKQSRMLPGQRIKNVKKSFAVSRRAKLQKLRVVLIDDVMTTGTTINECAKVLLAAGVASVQVATAARSIGHGR